MEKMHTINVAITSIGSGVGQSVIDSCQLSNLPLQTFGYGSNPFAFGSFACDVQRILPSIYSDNYIDALLILCKADKINILIPGLDDELLLLAEHLGEFNKIGVKIPISAGKLIQICRDKAQMSQELNQYGNFFVKSYNAADFLQQVVKSSPAYPYIAKPISGFASRGLVIIRTEDDLKNISEQHIIQELATPSISDPNHSFFMEELNKGTVAQVAELSLQLIISKNGKELGRFASYNKLHNGIPIEIIPAYVPEAWAAVDTFLPALLDLGVYGPLNIQGRLTDSGPKFFEMNARFTGITGLRALMGFNEVETVISDAVISGEVSHKLRQHIRKVGMRQVTNKVVDFYHNADLAGMCKTSGVVHSKESASRNVMVTGANSYIGRAVLDELIRHDKVNEVYALVRNPERFDGQLEPKLPAGATVVSVSDLLEGNFNIGSTDIICHLASARPVNSNEQIALSLAFTQFLTMLAQKYQIPGFINISSQSVYGTSHEPLWTESTLAAPETPYAQAKWAAELFTDAISQANPHCKVSSLRLGRVIGPSNVIRHNELPHKYIKAALKGEKISVWGGEQKMDFIDVRDVADVVAKICASPYQSWVPLLNVSAGCPVSVMDLARVCIKVAEQFGISGASIEIKDFQAPSCGMSIDKLQTQFGWSPRHDLLSSIQSVAQGL